ncbi:hypothetical protein D3C72_2419580 [compost metagenome]
MRHGCDFEFSLFHQAGDVVNGTRQPVELGNYQLCTQFLAQSQSLGTFWTILDSQLTRHDIHERTDNVPAVLLGRTVDVLKLSLKT